MVLHAGRFEMLSIHANKGTKTDYLFIDGRSTPLRKRQTSEPSQNRRHGKKQDRTTFLSIIVAERGGLVYVIYRLLPWDSFAWRYQVLSHMSSLVPVKGVRIQNSWLVSKDKIL
jgi:hypothetical protein